MEMQELFLHDILESCFVSKVPGSTWMILNTMTLFYGFCLNTCFHRVRAWLFIYLEKLSVTCTRTASFGLENSGTNYVPWCHD